MNLIKKFLEILFPNFCLFCKKEGEILCEDCFSTFEIFEKNFCLCQKPKVLFFCQKCPKCQKKHLDGLYFALSYEEKRVKFLIEKFKYKPYLKELAKPLAFFIIAHLNLIPQKPNFKNSLFLPIPLEKRRLKRRGFNQAEEIGKYLEDFFKVPLVTDCLLKIKKTPPQVELSPKERKKNIKGAFFVFQKEKIWGKKIFLIDDVYTTGATMQEAAKVLKKAGAKKVFGIVVARAKFKN